MGLFNSKEEEKKLPTIEKLLQVTEIILPTESPITCRNKFEKIISEPIGEKLCIELPGIGKIYSNKLEQYEIIYAYQLVGQYLVLKKDSILMNSWLVDLGINKNNSKAIVDTLESYCNSHF
jgi:Barrier to autointegration factor